MRLSEIINIKHNDCTVLSVYFDHTGAAFEALGLASYLGEALARDNVDVNGDDLIPYVAEFVSKFYIDDPTNMSRAAQNVIIHPFNKDAEGLGNQFSLRYEGYFHAALGITPEAISYLNDCAVTCININTDNKTITQKGCIVKLHQKVSSLCFNIKFNPETAISYKDWQSIIATFVAKRYGIGGCLITTPNGDYSLNYSIS